MIDQLFSLFGMMQDPVIAVRDGALLHFNGAAAGLIPDIAERQLSEILPGPAISGPGEFVGEAVISGRRMRVFATTVQECRLCVLTLPALDNRTDAAALLTGASVELKNTLAVLRMAMEYLVTQTDPAGSPNLDMHAAILRRCFYSLLRLTNNLGDLGAILRDDVPLMKTSFELVTCCRELIGSAGHLLGEAAEIRFSSNEDSIWIFADRLRLEQLLLNLLSNSVRNAPRSIVVTVTVVSAGDRVVLSVSDNGDGIGHDVLPTVWTRYNTDKSLSERQCGLGLGLTVVKNIAWLHGGTTLLESKPGEGTTVTVSMPLAENKTQDFQPDLALDGSCGMHRLLTELSSIVGYEKYSHFYMD